MDNYEQGFIDKCAELGVDPVALLKTAYGPTAIQAANPNAVPVDSTGSAAGYAFVRAAKGWLGAIKANPGGPYGDFYRGYRTGGLRGGASEVARGARSFLSKTRDGIVGIGRGTQADLMGELNWAKDKAARGGNMARRVMSGSANLTGPGSAAGRLIRSMSSPRTPVTSRVNRVPTVGKPGIVY